MEDTEKLRQSFGRYANKPLPRRLVRDLMGTTALSPEQLQLVGTLLFDHYLMKRQRIESWTTCI